MQKGKSEKGQNAKTTPKTTALHLQLEEDKKGHIAAAETKRLSTSDRFV